MIRIPPNHSASQGPEIPRHTADGRWTDGLGEHGPKIRVAPSSKRRSGGILAIVPEITLCAIAGAGLSEQRDTMRVVEHIRIPGRGSVDAEIGC